MRAVRWHASGDVRVDTVNVPSPQAGEVLIEVAYVGLCGTDIAEFDHGPVMIRENPHPLTGHRPPVTLGHEFSGVVAAVGAEVKGVVVGDRVAVDPCLRCGECRWCLRGQYHICARGGSIGLASDGALADFVVVPEVNVIRLPDGVSLQHAALAEPLAVGVHAVARGGVKTGDNVLILGGGPIGYASVLAAVIAGAAAVYVSEPLSVRADFARAAGATEAFDPTRIDVRREVFQRTGRIGPDVVIEATGRPDQYGFGVTTVRRGGTVVLAGVGNVEAAVDLRQLVLFERTVRGSLGYNFEIQRVLALMAHGRLDPEPMITDVLPLADTPETLARLSRDRGTQIKVLISVRGG